MQVGDRVLRQNKRSQQRKGGKLDPDYFGPYTVTKVDGKSVDLLDEYGKILPRVNLDHLVPFLEDPPPKSRKVTTSITTTSTNTLHGTVLSIPHTTTTLTPTLTFIYPITLPVPLQNILCPPLQPPASSAPLQPVASSAPLQPAASSAPLQPVATSAPLQPAASSAPLQPAASSAPLQPVASSAPLQPVASSAPLQPAASSAAVTSCSLPQADLLQDIWAGKVGGRLWSKVGPHKIFTWDLERLRPGEKLESEVINAYLTCIARRYPGKAGVIDSFQMTNLWKGKATEMKKMDPQAYDLLVGSVNEGDHWTLLIIYPQEGRIIYMNSCGESSNKIAHCIKAVRLNVKFAKAGTTGTA
ncbi:sentrin-specific protease 1-like isoform X1 [Labeo rohita]|uniref:Sentrin-specific protease 1-like isoform X1 n=1 Tax=Labeo rohita TaxID=84645 RepID=A0A498MR85_LABRO|nr:sentrin-specific protease 1-like isoform X1 [Labeo rohita]